MYPISFITPNITPYAGEVEPSERVVALEYWILLPNLTVPQFRSPTGLLIEPRSPPVPRVRGFRDKASARPHTMDLTTDERVCGWTAECGRLHKIRSGVEWYLYKYSKYNTRSCGERQAT